MKLNELAIEGNSSFPSISIRDLHHRLNLVHADKPEMLNALRRSFSRIMFGNDVLEHTGHPETDFWPIEESRSTITASRDDRTYRLSRSTALNSRLTAESVGNNRKIESSPELFGQMDRVLFDGLYCIDFGQTRERLQLLPTLLERRIGNISTHPRFSTRAQYEQWRVDAADRQRRLVECRSQLSTLEAEKNRLRVEMDSDNSTGLVERQRLESELNGLEAMIATARQDSDRMRIELNNFDRRIEELRLLIARRSTENELIPVESLSGNPLVVLYERLDEVDHQLVRWRRIHQAVQDRRIQLRDEMAIWADLTIEASEHPYHIAREIVFSIEDEVNNLDTEAREFEAKHIQALAALKDHAASVTDSCDSIRASLQQLCDELSNQFKSLRHRAAVEEFKQLRIYFDDITANIEYFLVRRGELLTDLKRLDAIGSDAIKDADVEFMKMAGIEGFLRARRRFHGTEPATTRLEYRSVAPDTSREQAQLDQLNVSRHQLRTEIARLDSVLHSRLQEKEIIAERLRGMVRIDLSTIQLRLTQCLNNISQIGSTISELAKEVELDQLVPPFVENATLVRAAELLDVLAEKNNHRLRLSPEGTRIQVASNQTDFVDAVLLEPIQQANVLLAVCSAAREQLATRGTVMPTFIFNATTWADADRLGRLLSFFANRNEQTIFCYRSTDVPASAISILSQAQHNIYPLFERPTPVTSYLTWQLADYQDYFSQPINWREQNLTAYDQPNLAPAVYNDTVELRAMNTFVAPAQVYSDVSLPGFLPPKHIPPPAPQQPTPQPTRFAPERHALPNSNLVMTEDMPLRNVDLVDSIHLKNLASAGITNFRSLLQLDPENLPSELETLGFDPGQIDRWQSQAWMMLCVPGLVPSETRLLIACGILEPEQLESTNSEQLLSRINRYLISPDGQRLSHGATQFSNDRINDWYRALATTRSRWRQDSGYSRRNRRSQSNRNRSTNSNSDSQPSNYFSRKRRTYEPGMRYFDGNENTDRDSDKDWNRDFERSNPSERQNHDRERLRQLGDRSGPTTREVRKFSNLQTSNEQKTTEQPGLALANDSQLKFYLNLGDHVEAAPSIGPKTAERFTSIGVNTIEEFLRMTADTMAEKINYKRINADVIRTWQNQARLVCRIPNLRGHDAQLLVACDIMEPEQLSGMNPKQLMALVGPFSETKEGLKIIRSGKKPDLEEVSDWIAWAKQTRSLQAA